ncbi:MAG: hypothetical protein EZS28_005784 [Streblomastix strix]|uniref:Uncharacterized protein n=1 Tax=Streblomastix strix TaxID=222440 RepID=A0A5J4WW03_9EUKA|nr:MAG: hypothetical protein EZS28_005784 [Streblomastix strix]
MVLQGANFASFRDNQIRRNTTAPNPQLHRELSSQVIFSEFLISNLDITHFINTIDSTCTEMEYDRDIQLPSKHVCCTTMLRRKVNLYPDSDERNRLRGLISSSGLQWICVKRNSTISCVETDTRIRKSGPSNPERWLKLRKHDGTGTIYSATDDVYTNLDYTTILFRTADTKNIDIISIPRIWHIFNNTIISGFPLVRPFLAGSSFFKLQLLILQIAEHQRNPDKDDCIRFIAIFERREHIWDKLKSLHSEIFGHRNVKYQEGQVQKIMGNIIEDLEMASQNDNVFIQRRSRHEYLTISEWKAFWREVDTDLYLDIVRMELDEDDNHHHHHDHDDDHDHVNNHKHQKERNDSNVQLDFAGGRKRRIVISSESSGNGQNNDDCAEGLHLEID